MESLPITQPDYTSLNASLKAYLKSRPELTDYEFDGSVLSTIVGMLAYNTTMNAFYLNQVANEAFLETASHRTSAVFAAQGIGYEVASKRAAYANVRLTLTPASPSSLTSITIPADSLVFKASVNEASFTFRSLKSITFAKNTSGKFVADLTIFEGKSFTESVSATQQIVDFGYQIKNVGIDYNTIQIAVNNAAFSKSNNIVSGVDSSSSVFFVRDYYGYPLVEFGDGVIGKKLNVGDALDISYIKTNGNLPNGIAKFSFVGAVSGMTGVVDTISAAVGGSDEESINSIKYNAPKFFESQGRAVTDEDYKVLAKNLFPSISDIIVWGGQDNVPPVYGKVFLSIKPYNGYYMTVTEKANIVAGLKKYNVVTITPEIVDPDYVYVDVVGSLEYDANKTTRDDAAILAAVRASVKSYADTQLGKFTLPIRYSDLTNIILSADNAITTTKFNFGLSKHITPVVGAYSDITVLFQNSLKEKTLLSSKFNFNNYLNCKFVDVGNGVIQIIDYTFATPVIVNPTAGTINYSTGELNITRTYLAAVDQSLKESTGSVYMDFKATAADFDVNTIQRNILIVGDVNLTVKKL